MSHGFLTFINLFFNETNVALWNVLHFEGSIFSHLTWVIGNLGVFGTLDIFMLVKYRISK